MSSAENMYGTIILWKLIPHESIATISVSAAIFEVKKAITEYKEKTNNTEKEEVC